MATFQPLTQSMMRGMSSTCRPWQVDGQFSALWSQPADLGRLMAGFQPPWTSGSQPADLGRFMATFQPLLKVTMNLPTLAGWWPLILRIYQVAVHLPTLAGSWPLLLFIDISIILVQISLKLHQNFIKTASKLYRNCIKTASKLHQNCIKITSKFHQNCTNYLSKGNPKVEINWQICRTVEVPVISSSHNWCGALHNR